MQWKNNCIIFNYLFFLLFNLFQKNQRNDLNLNIPELCRGHAGDAARVPSTWRYKQDGVINHEITFKIFVFFTQLSSCHSSWWSCDTSGGSETQFIFHPVLSAPLGRHQSNKSKQRHLFIFTPDELPHLPRGGFLSEFIVTNVQFFLLLNNTWHMSVILRDSCSAQPATDAGTSPLGAPQKSEKILKDVAWQRYGQERREKEAWLASV